jgi:RNA polymerase sigma-70 factor, ECF subfamily
VSAVPDEALKGDLSADSYSIEQCLRGDRQSFRALYQRYQPKVRSMLYQLCDSSSLDDLVQEVFLRVWKGLPQLRQTSQFATWLYRITWNVASDRRRQLASFKDRERNLSQMLPSSPTDRLLDNLHYQDLVRRGLEQLSFEHRCVLVMHDLEEVPQKEVAEILEIPVGTVKSRLFHARAAMRQFLQQSGVQL